MSTSRLGAAALFAVSTLLAADRLPTGAKLDPAAPSHPLGNMPLALVLAPDGRHAAVLLCGYREQGVQIVDRTSGEIVQTLPQRAAFLGLAFSPDGKSLWASGGNEDTILRYAWENGRAQLASSIPLGANVEPKKTAAHYPAGIAFSNDGSRLYVAENLSDTIAVIDTAQQKVVQRLDAGRYPYGVAVTKSGDVFVSCWGEHSIDAFRTNADGTLAANGRIAVARHPSAILANASGTRLYVASASSDTIAVVDTRRARVIAKIDDAPPSGPREGSTPNALALSRDGKRLFVAEGDNNAVAVISTATNKLLGRIPVEWYPAAVQVDGDALVVVNAKGMRSGPNPDLAQPGAKATNPKAFTLAQLDGSMTTVRTNGADLASLTKRVARANGWTSARTPHRYPPFRHVIYVIKENRTYDQLFGDMPAGDGDPALLFFGRDSAPNHHVLAERFGLFDRFFVNAEVSAHGHNWSTAAYVNDYTTKAVPQQYAPNGGRTYDYEGTNRGKLLANDDDDVASPSTGYLWDAALRKGIAFRNYGEYVVAPNDLIPAAPAGANFVTKKRLLPHTNLAFAPYDLSVPDQRRLDVWLADFEQFLVTGMPPLQIVRLPNDHTMGGRAGERTPRAFMADNDLALGRLVAAVSHSRFWRDTLILVVEDDAQNGPDHVDSHRSAMLAISAYNRPGVVHRFVNTTDVLATIEQLLGLDAMSQFDHYSRPLHDVFATTPDLRPYDFAVPAISLDERNPPATRAANASAHLDLDEPDHADDEALNRALWLTVKGEDTPYPGATRASVDALVH
jgi:YVTN family beta-propeller protein